jgi:hypothetical protein
MKINQHGTRQINGRINTLVDFLENVNDLQKWNYMGLTVEIDPTVDYNNQNMLIRWLDVQEGFNDRTIYNSLKEFTNHFSIVKA